MDASVARQGPVFDGWHLETQSLRMRRLRTNTYLYIDNLVSVLLLYASQAGSISACQMHLGLAKSNKVY